MKRKEVMIKYKLWDCFCKLLHVIFDYRFSHGGDTFPLPLHLLNHRLHRQWVKSICPTASRSRWTLSTNEDI